MSDLHDRLNELIKQTSANGEPDPANGRPADYADDALALKFASRHQHRLRFVKRWDRWMIWDGKRWSPDDTLRVIDLARDIAREASSEIIRNRGSKASLVASSKTVSAIRVSCARRPSSCFSCGRLGYRSLVAQHSRRHHRSSDGNVAAAQSR